MSSPCRFAAVIIDSFIKPAMRRRGDGGTDELELFHAKNTVRICGASFGVLFRFDEGGCSSDSFSLRSSNAIVSFASAKSR
jgi:hypothetical protein